MIRGGWRMNNDPEQRIRIRRTFKLDRGHHGQRVLEAHEQVETPAAPRAGRVPRISRLMALAIRFDRLLRDGAVADYAELARLSHVTGARITQIMNLLNLAPDIQEALLHLPLVECGRDPIREHAVRPIAVILDWRKQRRFWREVLAVGHPSPKGLQPIAPQRSECAIPAQTSSLWAGSAVFAVRHGDCSE